MTSFTIVTITFNAADCLARTLDSVLRQTHPAVEHLIIDGNSHDGTLEAVHHYQERNSVARVPHDVLLRFVGELPDGYRAVFNLYCIEGLPHREIAEMLGINEKSSSSQLFRARTILARRIKDYLKTH